MVPPRIHTVPEAFPEARPPRTRCVPVRRRSDPNHIKEYAASHHEREGRTMLISHGPVRHTYKPEAGCDRPCALSGVPGDCVARLCVPESRPVAAWFKWLARNSDPLHLRRRGIHPHVASNDFALSSGANLFQLLCQQRDFWPSPRPVWRHRTSSRPVSACRDVDLCRADGHLDIAVFGTTDSRGRGPSRLNPPTGGLL